MKRRISSDQSLRHLKRANSSLFSIATIVEDDDGAPLEVSDDTVPSSIGSSLNLLPLKENKDGFEDDVEGGRARFVSVSAPSSPPLTPSSSRSDVSSDDGFYIDDDASDNDEAAVEPALGQPFLSSSGPLPERTKEEPAKVLVDAEAQPAKVSEQKGDLRVGVIFEAGEKHFDRHNRFHKERPLRVTSIRDHLTSCSTHDFIGRCALFGETASPDTSAGDEMAFLEDDDYLRVHLPGYMQRLDRLSTCSCCDRLDREAEQFKSIYFTPDSVQEARIAAASLCRLVSNVMTDKLDNGFAVIRPPGHHAEPGLAGGYCVINNVAVAAAYAREKLGAKKILIVDWDVHHGNGTQSIFLNDPDVLYFSVHRYDGGNFFPFLQKSGPTTVGNGSAAGKNINVGWNKKFMGDEEYVAVWEKILMPVADEFEPDLVLVSAGFDAAKGDLGECSVTPECFGRLTRRFMTLANGKIVCTLEGGYVRSVLGRCVEHVVASLIDGESVEKSNKEHEMYKMEYEAIDILDSIDKSAANSIRKTIEAHKPYWSCLREEDDQESSCTEEKKQD